LFADELASENKDQCLSARRTGPEFIGRPPGEEPGSNNEKEQ